ncbi:glycoside hydrolase family 3 C-terminal domain-containing protein [soil metagenome]
MNRHVDKLDQLTVKEKASLLGGSDLWHTQAIDRLDIPSIMLSDGPHGLRVQYAEGDHLGAEGSEPATCFPPAVALASSWNVELVARTAAALADEARAAGVDVLLGPGINMKRTPLCGRNFEYYSEDPLLTGVLAAAFAEGVQSRGVGTALKHFAANNQETERMSISVQADERTLREIYLAAFETVVTEAQPWTVMCSYNRINGRFASEDPWLLTQVLRDDWGFDGVVVSDWGAVNRRDLAVSAGLELEMPSSSGAGTAVILAAIADGTLTMEEVDRAAMRMLELIDRVGDADHSPVVVDYNAQHAIAYEAALEGAVLLKNDDDILPISDGPGRIAVVGEFARTPRYQGAGSSQVNSIRVDAALDSLRARLGGSREVTFSAGYEIDRDDLDPALIAEAAATARGAELVLLFVGLPSGYESESFDRPHMALPPSQLALIDAVVAANPRVVVVLSNGGVVQLDPWANRIPAILEGWLLGEAGGAAVTALLLGDVSPSGRLAETIPLRYEHNPTVGNFPGELGTVTYGERILVGYRWYDAHRLDVSYPFGHGLSYTTFDYGSLVVTSTAEDVQVDVTITNSGTAAASEVVQLYVADTVASVLRPDQELKAFSKVHLQPGESRVVRLTLTRRAFAFWHPVAARWTVEGGAFDLRIGSSSRDIRLRSRIEREGDVVDALLTIDSPAGDWWDHPVLGSHVRERITGRYGRLLADPHESPLFSPIPLSRMIRFPGFTMTEEQAAELLASL